MAAANYYFKPDAVTNPFIGLGIGTLYANRDVNMGMFTMEDDTWQFALRPEIGTRITTMNVDLILAAKYMMGFESDNLEATNYFSINVGFVF